MCRTWNLHIWHFFTVCVSNSCPRNSLSFLDSLSFPPSGGSEMKNRENVRGNMRGHGGALHDRWLVCCVPTCSVILRDTYPFRFIGTGYCPGILSRAQTSSSTLICLSFNYEINAWSNRPAGRMWHVTWCDVIVHVHTHWSRLQWNEKCTSLLRVVFPLPAKQNSMKYLLIPRGIIYKMLHRIRPAFKIISQMCLCVSQRNKCTHKKTCIQLSSRCEIY